MDPLKNNYVDVCMFTWTAFSQRKGLSKLVLHSQIKYMFLFVVIAPPFISLFWNHIPHGFKTKLFPYKKTSLSSVLLLCMFFQSGETGFLQAPHCSSLSVTACLMNSPDASVDSELRVWQALSFCTTWIWPKGETWLHASSKWKVKHSKW